MTRTQNVKKNFTFNLIKFVTQLVLQFVLRTILIYYMGAEYLGLDGLFVNIFSFLNLAELGIGSAIVFSMYKPIAEGDTEKIKALQNVYKKFYSIIAIVVLCIGLLLLPFLKYLIKYDVSVNINIYILYLMYLCNAMASYFSAHKRSLLFAHEKNNVENKIKTVCLFSMTIIQILVIVFTKNYYIYFAVNILFTWIESILVRHWANKIFPEINGKSEPLDEQTKKDITKNITALSMHKIGGAVVFSTDSILISAFLGVTILGAYSNYSLIVSCIGSFFTLFVTALTASVGSLVANKSVSYAYGKFKQINTMFSMLCSFATICLIVLFQPFIQKWTGGGEYLLDFSTVIIISLSFYFTKMRAGQNVFRDAAGIFWQDRWKSIVEAVVNLVVSIALVFPLGINGIFIGTIISTLVAPFWVEPYVLYKYYFKRSCKEYFIRYIIDFAIMCSVGAISYFVCSLIPTGGIWLLILRFAVCIILTAGLLVLAYLPCKEFKELCAMAKNGIKNLFNKKKKVEATKVATEDSSQNE